MKRILLCLDGTWNSTYQKGQRDDGIRVVKPTNVLKLARAVKPIDEHHNEQVVYYHTGVGAMSKYPGFSNRFLSKIDNYFGGAWGAGFEANVEDALTFLVNNYNHQDANNQPDQVFILGFSRGAAAARAMTQFIAWMGGVPSKADAFFLPKLFRQYMRGKGQVSVKVAKATIYQEINALNEHRSRNKIDLPFQSWQKLRINFLGVWDSVLALGGRIITMKNRKFYLHNQPAQCVDHVRHALAIDEQRYDFLPEIWQSPHIKNLSLKQRWFAGVHSNVGGGYTHDGLANVTLHWLVGEIKSLFPAFVFDETFLNKYRPYFQDELVDSKSKTYKIKDFMLRKKGLRTINTQLDQGFEDSGLDIDLTALQRLLSSPDGHNRMTGNYLPKNLLAYIQKVGMRKILADEITANLKQLNQFKNISRMTEQQAEVFEEAVKKSAIINKLLAYSDKKR